MLERDDTAVILIDVQGKLATLMHERQELYRQLQILLRGARILQLPVLWLEQYPKGLGPTVPEIADLLEGLTPIAKTSFSACGDPVFRQALAAEGCRSVVLAGIEAHVCVHQTARDLLDEGFHIEVVADAVSSRTAQNRNLGLERMRAEGAAMTSVEMLLFELLREAGSPEFREISKLVR